MEGSRFETFVWKMQWSYKTNVNAIKLCKKMQKNVCNKIIIIKKKEMLKYKISVNIIYIINIIKI